MVFLVGPIWMFMIAYGFSPLKCTKSFELKGYKDDLVFFFFEICDLLILVLIDVALRSWIYPNFIPQTARVSKDWGAETVLHWTEHGSWQTFKVSDAGKGLERSTHKGLVVVLHSEICRVCSCKPRILQREQHMFQSVFRFSRGQSDLKQMNVPMFWEDT